MKAFKIITITLGMIFTALTAGMFFVQAVLPEHNHPVLMVAYGYLAMILFFGISLEILNT